MSDLRLKLSSGADVLPLSITAKYPVDTPDPAYWMGFRNGDAVVTAVATDDSGRLVLTWQID